MALSNKRDMAGSIVRNLVVGAMSCCCAAALLVALVEKLIYTQISNTLLYQPSELYHSEVG